MVIGKTSRLAVTLPSDREIALSREFDAPRDLVFAAFSRPEHLRHWWGRRGSTLTVCDMDFRPGGTWRMVERDADGNEWGFHGEIREIAPPERVVQTFEFEGMPGHVAVDTLRLDDLGGGRTRLTVTSAFDSVEDRDGMLQSGMEEGAGESYDQLAEYLERGMTSSERLPQTSPTADREIVISRVFNAPRDLVFNAWTDSRHIAEWWGPNGFTTTVHEMDVRPGGVWRFVMHGPDGVDYDNKVVFHEVVPPERLTFTHGTGAPDDQGFEVTVTFVEESAGNTRLTLRQQYATTAERDYVARQYRAVEMGYQTLDRFAAFVETVLSR